MFLRWLCRTICLLILVYVSGQYGYRFTGFGSQTRMGDYEINNKRAINTNQEAGLTGATIFLVVFSSVVVGCFVFFAIGTLLFGCCDSWPTCPPQLDFRRRVPSKNSFDQMPNSTIVPFTSGFYTSRFYHDGIWHESKKIILTFQSQQTTVVEGEGADEMGHYTIKGTYSPATLSMCLTKQYQVETIDNRMIIQLVWCPIQQHFYGNYNFETLEVNDENRFELKLLQTPRHVSFSIA